MTLLRLLLAIALTPVLVCAQTPGQAVRATMGTEILLTPTTLAFPNTGLSILDSDGTHKLTLSAGSNLTAARTLTFNTGDANRTLTLDANVSLDQDLLTSSDVEFESISTAGDITAPAFFGDGSGITNLDAGEITTGTLAYARGGTNAGTQAAARVNIGGAKSFASGAALQAGSADYGGQLCFTTDGISFSIARDTGAGNTDLDLVCLNNLVYFTNMNVTDTTTTWKLNSIATGGVFIDNPINVHNTTGGYSSTAYWHPADTFQAGRAFAVGIGPNGSTHDYHNAAYLSTNPQPSTPDTAPPNIVIGQERSDGAPSNQHTRMLFDGDAKSVTIYGWSTSAIKGPVGISIDSSGNTHVGGGTSATELRFMEPSGSGTNYTGFKAPALAGNVVYTLPTADGTSENTLTTDGNKVLSWTTWPKVRVQEDASPQVVANSTITLIAFPTESEDASGLYSAGTYTAPRTGYLRVSGCIGWDAANNIGIAAVDIYKDAGGTFVCRAGGGATIGGIPGSSSFSVLISVTASDTIGIYMTQTSGANLTLSANGYANAQFHYEP